MILAPLPAAPRASRAALAAGVVAVPVADQRRQPDHASELVNQVLFGETVRVRRVSPDRRWVLVVSQEDGYGGWMRSWSLALGTEAAIACWRRAARRMVERPWLERAELPGGALPFGARLVRARGGGALGPLGPLALVEGWRGTAAIPRARSSPGRGRRVVATARRFLGASYHWGGRSFAGIDCSGLVQLATRRHGLVLPRDARQQCGVAQGSGRLRPLEAPGCQPGDLWFFGPTPRKVTHVALSTGGLGLLHAYGSVRAGSLDPLSPVFEPELFRSVLGWQILPKH